MLETTQDRRRSLALVEKIGASFGSPTLVSCGDKINPPHSPALACPTETGKLLRVTFGPAVQG